MCLIFLQLFFFFNRRRQFVVCFGRVGQDGRVLVLRPHTWVEVGGVCQGGPAPAVPAPPDQGLFCAKSPIQLSRWVLMPKSCVELPHPHPRLGPGCHWGARGSSWPARPCLAPLVYILERAEEACRSPGTLGEGFNVLHQDTDVFVFLSLQYLKYCHCAWT